MKASFLPQGAELVDGGVRYALWAPTAHSAEIQIYDQSGNSVRQVPLRPGREGHFVGIDLIGRAHDRFEASVNGGTPFPPPSSHFQPAGVHGPAEVLDPLSYKWHDSEWKRPVFRDLVIYELHIGTFTPTGTFRAAIDRLPYLRDLGVNSIEIMPVADFPGEWGWGYDGVQLFAPARCYGHPDDFRALIDAAHQHGLAVILDVVYNHFGPSGNYSGAFSPYYLEDKDHTPWGNAVNFGREFCEPVREFYRANLLYWMDYFHIDGFRLDATQSIVDPSPEHILSQLAQLVRARGGYIIAEDERNENRIITGLDEGGFGFHGVWADDFHHSVEAATVEASRYTDDFTGELFELVEALQHGWIYRGQISRHRGCGHGTPCQHLPYERFIFCISNHDQIGNRAFGERLNHLVNPASYRAASTLLLLSPYTPLLFQGQEWGASTPFLYFTDHEPELGQLVEEGRRRECRFEIFSNGATDIPSPQARDTFEASKLKWDETSAAPHAGTLLLYRELLRLRREHSVFRPIERAATQFNALPSGIVAMRGEGDGETWLMLCDLTGGHSGSLSDTSFTTLPDGNRWSLHLSSDEPRFGGTDANTVDLATGGFAFRKPGALLFQVLS